MLEGCKAIAAALGPDVRPRRVRRLAAAGAPIRILFDGRGIRYLADSEALSAWLRGNIVHPRASSGI